jgi:hypothetical protein
MNLPPEEDLKAITEPLAKVMIERKLSCLTMLLGIHGFLTALQAAGHADAAEVSHELDRMSDYFRSLTKEASDTDDDTLRRLDWKN